MYINVFDINLISSELVWYIFFSLVEEKGYILDY